MKEFVAETGGRYTYSDDLENIQDIALAFSQLFSECNDFVISGCNVSGGGISSGYVYLNGKVRYFSGADSSTVNNVWPQYIYEVNQTVNVNYQDSETDKRGRNEYLCGSGSSVPGSVHSITIQSSGIAKRLKDEFFGRYSLLLNPMSPSVAQTVNGRVFFSQDVGFTGNISSASANIAGTATIGRGNFTGLMIQNNQIWQQYDNSDDTTISINKIGYSGADTRARNFYVGDGKGNEMFYINGLGHTSRITGQFSVADGNLMLQSSASSINPGYVQYLRWTYNNGSTSATIGFPQGHNQRFTIQSSGCNVQIKGSQGVYIAPYIYEDGVKLSEKYALQSNVYSKAESDSSYMPKLKDTGWLDLTSRLHVRQYGKVVSVQGRVDNLSGANSTLFTLPNTVDAPDYDVIGTFTTAEGKTWTCRISGGSRTCTIIHSEVTTTNTVASITLTYIV